MTDKVLVVGGRGYLGRHVVTAMRAAGVDALSASRQPDADIPMDLRDGASVEAGLARAGATSHIVLTIGSATPGQGLGELSVHWKGVQTVLEHARNLPGLQRVVLVSSVLVYGDADPGDRLGGLHFGQRFDSLYGYAKFRSERVLEQFDLPARVVRPALLMGASATGAIDPGQVTVALVDNALSVPVIPLERGGRFRVWHAPVDVVAADVVAAALEEDVPDVVLSVDPASLDLADLLRELLRPFLRRPTIVDLGRLARSGVLRAALGRLGIEPEWLVHARPWPPLNEAALAANRQRLAPMPGGYVQRTARAIHASYASAS